VARDFNAEKLKYVLPHFYQHVTTRGEKNSRPPLLHTVTCTKLSLNPPFSKSDHNSILLLPAYKLKLKQEVPVARLIPKWSDDADGKLQYCLLAQTGICSGILPDGIVLNAPHQSLASSISALMTLPPQ
jgi:hypothetical protein